MAGDGDKTPPSSPKKLLHGGGSSSPRAVVVERVTAFTGDVLKQTKVNYHEWALEMQVHMEGMEVWDAVETGYADHDKDQRIFVGIFWN